MLQQQTPQPQWFISHSCYKSHAGWWRELYSSHSLRDLARDVECTSFTVAGEGGVGGKNVVGRSLALTVSICSYACHFYSHFIGQRGFRPVQSTLKNDNQKYLVYNINDHYFPG